MANAQGQAAPAAGPETPGQTQSGRTLKATLSGAEGIPGPGDADGRGTATVTLAASSDEICYELAVENIAPANAAHIHRGAAGQSGPPVVPLEAPKEGTVKGCVSVEPAVAQEIARNPTGYYVNVHNAEFPAGAIRGQLSE